MNEVLQRAIAEAAGCFPTANLGQLAHGFRSFVHPAFMPAWDRVKSATAVGRAVRGVFDPKNSSQRARGFRDRVHFLVFIAETSYAPDEIARTARYKANPMLFEGAADVNAALSAFPLFGPDRK